MKYETLQAVKGRVFKPSSIGKFSKVSNQTLQAVKWPSSASHSWLAGAPSFHCHRHLHQHHFPRRCHDIVTVTVIVIVNISFGRMRITIFHFLLSCTLVFSLMWGYLIVTVISRWDCHWQFYDCHNNTNLLSNIFNSSARLKKTRGSIIYVLKWCRL